MMALLEDYANERIRRERVFREHEDFLADWLISRVRFPRAVLLDLCAELGPVLANMSEPCHPGPYPGPHHSGVPGNLLFPAGISRQVRVLYNYI